MTIFTDASGSDDEHELSDADVDSILKGRRPLGGAPEAHRLADVMNALSSPPERSELVGYSEVMATYGRAFARPRSRRVAMISSAAGLKAMASAAGAAVALGGVATIVFASGAMGPAHPTLVAPVATSATKTTAPKDDKTGTPVGPDASGPAAFGLCNAWTHHQDKDRDKNQAKDGDKDEDRAKDQDKDGPGNSVAFRNLAEAAGGEAKIAAYCAKVPHPGSPNATKGPKSPATSSGKPGKAPATPPGKAKPSSPGTARTPGASTPTTTAPAPTLTPPTPATTLPTTTS